MADSETRVTGRKRPDRVPEEFLERLPQTAPLDATLRETHEALAYAATVFEHLGDGGRRGTELAIAAIHKHFAEAGLPPAVLAPLRAVTVAIDDARRGRESPIFKPTRKGRGAPPKSSGRLVFEGFVAAIAELCVRHFRSEGRGEILEPAYREASRMLAKRHPTLKMSAGQIGKVRTRANETPGARTMDRMTFDQILNSPAAEVCPIEYARGLVASKAMIYQAISDAD